MSLLGLKIGARKGIAVMRVWVWFNHSLQKHLVRKLKNFNY